MPKTEPARPVRQSAPEFSFGTFGELERRVFPIEVEDVRDSSAGGGQFTVRGHASVFNQWSLDLGGFREKIAKGAFDEVLARNPDVWLLWDHDTRWTLARTSNKTLELRTDPRGLHYWGRVAPTSYAADLRVLMDRGDIDQASFAFTVAQDEWKITGTGDDERVERTIVEVGELFDVTITAMGAYPQTDAQIAAARSYAHSRLDVAPSEEDAEPEAPQDGAITPAEVLAAEGRAAAPETVASETIPLDALKRASDARTDLAREEYRRLVREMTR